jgi:hypothetical protein
MDRDDKIIVSIARLEERQIHMHDDIKKLLNCDEEFDDRINSLEHTRTYVYGIVAILAVIVSIVNGWLVNIAKGLGLI